LPLCKAPSDIAKFFHTKGGGMETSTFPISTRL